MKNKGFTLTELIGVITLLGIIALIAVPIINKTITNSKNKSYNAQIKAIEDAGKKWGVENTDLLPADDDTQCNISLVELINAGYLENDQIKDPRDKSMMQGSIEISYTSSTQSYHYDYKESPDTGLSDCIK